MRAGDTETPPPLRGPCGLSRPSRPPSGRAAAELMGCAGACVQVEHRRGRAAGMAVPAFSCVLFSGQGDSTRPRRKAHTGRLWAAVRLSRPGEYPWGAGRPQRRRVALLAGFLRFIAFYGLGGILAGMFWAWQSRRQRLGVYGSARTRGFPVCRGPTRYGPKRDFALFGAGGVALLREQRTPGMACRARGFQKFLHVLSTKDNTPPKPVLPTGRTLKPPI